MRVGRRSRLVRLVVFGVFLLLPAGWASSLALAEEAPVPTVPVPTTVAPDPVPPPAATPRPDPAPRPRARPAPAPATPAPSRPRVFTPAQVTQPTARPDAAQIAAAKARATAKAKAKAKAVATAKARAKAKARARAKARENAAALAATALTRADPPSTRPSRPVVTLEPLATNTAPAQSNPLLTSAMAFLAGLLIPVIVVASVVVARRRRPSTPSTQSPSLPAPSTTPALPPESRVYAPPPAVARPAAPPIAVEREVVQPVADREEPPESVPEKAPVADPIQAATEEWAGWEFCEIDWWRGYFKSHFFAKATTPGEADYIVRESPMFRWRGNGIPEATPESIAAHEELIESLRTEGWEDDPGTAPTWYGQTFRRPRDPDALAR